MLFGAAEAQRAAINSHMLLPEQREYDSQIALLRTQMVAAALDAAWSRGRALSLDEAVQLADG